MNNLNKTLNFGVKETRIDLDKEFFEHEELIFYHGNFDVSKIKPNQGYYSSMVRVILVTKGSARYLVNSRPYDLTESQLLIIPSGDIFTLADNHNLESIGFCYVVEDFPLVIPVVITLTEENVRSFLLYMDLIWEMLKKLGYKREIIYPLFKSISQWFQLAHYNDQNYYSDSVIVKFINLVNENSDKERTLNFYASKLFMTPHYLSAYIRKVTGYTFTRWINYSVVQKINILLRYSDKTVNEIADEMNFASGPEMSRYYKRHTGITPYKYRKND